MSYDTRRADVMCSPIKTETLPRNTPYFPSLNLEKGLCFAIGGIWLAPENDFR